MDERTICQNIKTLRLARKMTLDDLSHLTGLSKGYLSRVERAGKLPPFSTLNRIAGALGVETISLLNGRQEPPGDTRLAIVRKNERKVIVTTGSLYGYKYETLAHNKLGKSMEPYIIEPAFEEKAIFQHEGEELLFVLEGTHEFTYDGKKYIMHEGDCVYFESGVPHTGRSIGQERARLLAVMFSYKTDGRGVS
ncbi:MAG TPA: XRE family transcriptional regulator [Desulfomonilaceae bacterium]|nr:XRE family transcriptional regulator [Desulfomonilaceae bacterium]